MIFCYENNGLDKYKRRRSLAFNKRWIGRNASEESLQRYCIEIWSDLVRTRDEYQCFMCGSKNFLAAHHIISKKWLKTAFDINCGITLCKNCHDNSVCSAHMSPWIFEKILREKKPKQYIWYLLNRINVSNIEQENINYHDVLKKLLEEFEIISPSTIQRSNYFKYSEGEEKQIIHEFINLEAPIKMIARKWNCSDSSIRAILERHKIIIVSEKSRKRNKEMLQKICGHCVLKLDDNGNVLREYVSMNDAAKQNGLVINSVRNCVKGYSKTAGGHKWIYKKDFINKKPADQI